MTESLLHMVWRFQLFNQVDLVDHRGFSVQIISPGAWNHNEGPDFLEAHLKIEGIDWYGHVEIHKDASEWSQHGHDTNAHYDNVIAHVVFKNNYQVKYTDSEREIPTVELDGRIYPHVLRNHKGLVENLNWIPCSGNLSTVYSPIKWQSWSERLLAERLESKTLRIKRILMDSDQNWSKSFFTWLSYGFGLKVNSDAMMQFAGRVNLIHVEKYHYDLDMIQAMFFGLAGMLQGTYVDEYPKRLQDNFTFLQNKYGYSYKSPILWKFHRMRPVAFPTTRLSQLAHVLQKEPRLLSKVLESSTIKELKNLLGGHAHDYWERHSKWDASTEHKSIKMGSDFIHRLIINVVAPFVYCYGQELSQEKYKERAISWLMDLKSENNKIIRSFKEEGIEVNDASHTQALYHLKQKYCDEHRCMECVFGFDLINNKT